MVKATSLLGTLLVGSSLLAAEHHVSPSGSNENKGTRESPYRTISAAAQVAQPGDVITVHAGTYRERITPPRGGASDAKRIVYQAGPGERVEVKGSELVKNWAQVQDDVWKVTLPNSFFGGFNPYSDLIHGDWFAAKGREHHTGSVYLNGKWLIEAAKLDEVLKPGSTNALWFGRVDGKDTTIWARFKGVNPNESLVEINVRPTVFTPEKAGINYLTVRGFTMCHAASNWAPPTAGQFGLISAYWCKGWIIENNEVSYSKCSGIALGKHGDEFDNKSANSAEGYVETIKRAYKNGWTRENIGHHLVRNNHIHHCEQTGIVGSMGCAFSTITGNEIHDIHVLGLFGGAEMAGIKFHAAVDTEISGNHIYRCGAFGLWLDWMTQGTSVTRNLMHENNYDILLEVNHGPFLVANNILLSGKPIFTMSNGGAFAHNLFQGPLKVQPEYRRVTPYLEPHATSMVELKNTEVGDDRWFNNLATGAGDLSAYTNARLPVFMGGNVFLNNAIPSVHESTPLVKPRFDPAMKFTRESDGTCYLEITVDKTWGTERTRKLVTTDLLGRAALPNQAYELPDGSPLKVDVDYFGNRRNAANPFPGPFEIPEGGQLKLKVWPLRKPNIVFLLADDLGYGDLSCYGQQKFKTPNIDRLAAEGMKFTAHYSGHNVCAPARCVLLSGKHPGHAYIRSNRGPLKAGDEGQEPVPEGELQLPLTLKKLGYTMGGFGKWGLGPVTSSGDPNQQGFDLFFGYNCQGVAHNYYPTHLWSNQTHIALGNPKFSAHQKLPPGADLNSPATYAPFTAGNYAPDLIAEQALKFIRENKDRPFFVYYATTVPHLALQVPEDSLKPFEGRFPETPYDGSRGYLPHRTPRAAYAAMIARLDGEVGRVLDLVRALGLDEQTIFIFTSDNGPLYDQYGGTDNDFFNSAAGFRGRKGSFYEGGFREPCLVRWKGKIAPGTLSHRVTGFEDWLPTLLDLVGADTATPKGIDGISFAPTLLGRKQETRPFLYREAPDYGGQQCVRAGDWKMVRQNLNGNPRAPKQLYNLADDPSETTDVAAQHPDIVRKLETIAMEQHANSPLWPIAALDKFSR
jgi:arylsulfatase A-like enzyme